MARQERATRTRRAILEGAATAFDELGYEGASTTEILTRVGVTRGALYHHFPSKEAIAAAVVDLQEEALHAPEHAVRLQAAIDLTMEYARRLRTDPLLRASVRLTVEQSSFTTPRVKPYQGASEALRGVLVEAEERGELLPGLDLREVTEFMVGAFTGLQLVSQVYSGREDLLERVSVMWRLLLPGIAVPGLLPRLRTQPPPTCGSAPAAAWGAAATTAAGAEAGTEAGARSTGGAAATGTAPKGTSHPAALETAVPTGPAPKAVARPQDR